MPSKRSTLRDWRIREQVGRHQVSERVGHPLLVVEHQEQGSVDGRLMVLDPEWDGRLWLVDRRLMGLVPLLEVELDERLSGLV